MSGLYLSKRLLFACLFSFFFFVSVSIFLNSPKKLDPGSASSIQTKSFLIKGEERFDAVASVGAEITHELAIIDSVAANLTEDQFQQLSKMNVQLVANYGVKSSGLAWGQRIGYSQASAVQMSNAETLHDQYIFGGGVTIAVVDTGFKS